MAGLATCAVVLIGLPIAYLLAKRSFPGKALLETTVALPLVLPPTVTGFLLVLVLGRQGWIGKVVFRLFGRSLLFTWQVAALAAAVVALPLLVRSARSAIEAVDLELEQVANTLGQTDSEVAFKVTLPLAAPGIIAGVVLAFCRALGEFGATIMVAGNIPGRTTTLALEIYRAFEMGQDQRAMAAAVVLVVFSFLVVYWAEKVGRAALR